MPGTGEEHAAAEVRRQFAMIEWLEQQSPILTAFPFAAPPPEPLMMCRTPLASSLDASWHAEPEGCPTWTDAAECQCMRGSEA